MARPSTSKYRAIKETVDGITFHSRKEANRYRELKLLEKAGEITHLGVQPVFVLSVPGFRGGMTTIDIGKYIADFIYNARQGDGWVDVVEDVKGVRTPVYKLKKKMVEAQYGIKVIEI